ncbi:MAG: lipoprotein signal peptidase [Lysobacteraceae bacterium]|nr:MAG: lipoprotein signal peptidase [Xanthomonadaceae bacterium]
MRRPAQRAVVWLPVSAGVLVLDLVSKQLALEHLVLGVPVPVIEGFWNWTLAYNTGAAFSFLAEASGWQRWLFAGFALGISALLTHWLWRLPREDWRQALPFSLIIGGALGNLVDRIRHGHVVDFIDWHWRGYHWPAFNVADAAIVTGAVALIVFSFVRSGKGA